VGKVGPSRVHPFVIDFVFFSFSERGFKVTSNNIEMIANLRLWTH
jgi:hypothetical protein